jgi:hypothetical protein
MLEWDTAPKRWVPASRREEIKCDGCGERANLFAMCTLSCKFLHKCVLCRKCYLIRKSCTFFITLEDIQPRRESTDEFQKIKIDAKRKLKD